MKTGERPATITTPRAKVILTRDQVIADYRLAVRSRVASELGRREVLNGKAPFGIFGDGKEIANLGMAHAFRPGDWRSGYYRDQTFMLAVGLFWESMNAAGILQIPLVVGVWDDGYGISVPNELQVIKRSVSAAMAGFERDGGPGFEIRVVKGWDYVALIDTFTEVTEIARRDHVPALVHVVEVTQPQGHSTSGSHERYKPKERLRFEIEGDPF